MVRYLMSPKTSKGSFLVKFDVLLHDLSNILQTSYVFIDSNIDLLN
jgi:hypothetical protein